jgi:hypothetical protein
LSGYDISTGSGFTDALSEESAQSFILMDAFLVNCFLEGSAKFFALVDWHWTAFHFRT